MSRKISVEMRSSESTAKLITEQKSDMIVQAWVSSWSMSSTNVAESCRESVVLGFVHSTSDAKSGYGRKGSRDGLLKKMGFEPP